MPPLHSRHHRLKLPGGWLLLLAMILVPIDVGVRRVALTRGDFVKARGWIARRLGLARPAPEVVPRLAELRAARGRSQRRAERAPRPRPEAPPAAPISEDVAPSAPPPGAAAEQEAQPVADQAPETLAERLARRRKGG